MSTNYFFKSISVENFRVFGSISLDRAKRINLLGGMNGSGKSALMETLFLCLDLANPGCLIRPFQWRSIPLTGDDLSNIFPNRDAPAKIITNTEFGPRSMELSFGPPNETLPFSTSSSMPAQIGRGVSPLSAASSTGVSIRVQFGSGENPVMHMFVSQSGDQFNVTGMHMPSQHEVSGTYLSQAVPSLPNELSDRVSKIIRARRKPDFIRHLNILSPEIRDIEVLQDGPTAQVYVVCGEDLRFVPLALMGGGLRALADIVSCAMVSKGGVIFIDELDSALHYSVVPKLWAIIANTINEENVQVFAVSHSKETIASAAKGVLEARRGNDFQYIRIDRGDGRHSCTTYSIDEVSDALELNVEIR